MNSLFRNKPPDRRPLLYSHVRQLLQSEAREMNLCLGELVEAIQEGVIWKVKAAFVTPKKASQSVLKYIEVDANLGEIVSIKTLKDNRTSPISKITT